MNQQNITPEDQFTEYNNSQAEGIWKQIMNYPKYQDNSEGYVRKIKRKKILKPLFNKNTKIKFNLIIKIVKNPFIYIKQQQIIPQKILKVQQEQNMQIKTYKKNN
ncbi:hypothetical protein ABPG72_012812 [Tetrahymena utriculariae]